MLGMVKEFEHCYRALQSRDARFDGWFYVGVHSTGIYCRPSCPAITPKRENVGFYPTAAAAQIAGHRACKRCRPDVSPGSPDWNQRATLAGRAMRLIADGVVDREGVGGLSARLGYSERQVNRHLNAELGAGAIAIARAQRAQTARTLIERTTMPVTEVAFAAGFSSVRQFNDTIRAVFAASPTELRHGARNAPASAPGGLSLRLACRTPFDGRGVLDFLGARAVPGVETREGDTFRRSLNLPHGWAVASLTPAAAHVDLSLRLGDLRDLPAAVERCRRLFDLDADPVAIDEALSADLLLHRLVARTPGRRVPGTVDGNELAMRAIFGQQVSVAAARTLAGRLTTACGTPLPEPDGALTHLFPTPERVAAAGPTVLAMPSSRANAIMALAKATTGDGLQLDLGADRERTTALLLELPGVGPWTAGYVAMRALGDPDVLLAGDLAVRNAIKRLGGGANESELLALGERWRPWRSYANVHLWASLSKPNPKEAPQ